MDGGLMDGCAWMDGWMDGWMGERKDKWMDDGDSQIAATFRFHSMYLKA